MCVCVCVFVCVYVGYALTGEKNIYTYASKVGCIVDYARPHTHARPHADIHTQTHAKDESEQECTCTCVHTLNIYAKIRICALTIKM